MEIFLLQTEIAKRLSALISQVVPFLSNEHQQQVLTAVERAKQITMSELNAVIGVSIRELKAILQYNETFSNSNNAICLEFYSKCMRSSFPVALFLPLYLSVECLRISCPADPASQHFPTAPVMDRRHLARRHLVCSPNKNSCSIIVLKISKVNMMRIDT